MCGIAGHVGPTPLPAERIRRTLALMRHRGPDHADHRAFATPDGRSVELLFTRLSIIDLDPRANQPFALDGRWLVFNGELYNYREVRAELESDGVRFRTDSDTEVLLAAITRRGWDALDVCEGMWALAVYDERDATLTLSRDRFGEKPLLVHADGDNLYFGSEPKLLFAMLGRPLPVNHRQVHRHIVNGYRALHKTSETFFRGLHALPAGTLMRVGADGVGPPETYWSRGAAPEEADMGYEEAVHGTRDRLIRAVELRLHADVPLAFCMSGGVDSMSLIAVAKRVCGYDVHGFTILNADARYEETDMVEHGVRELGLRHTFVGLDTAGFLERLRALVHHHDAPISTVTYYVHRLLMEAIAAHGYRIAISGTAADELFTGYYDHHLAYLADVRGDPVLHARALAAWRAHIAPIVRNPFLQDPGYLVADPRRRDHIFLDAEEFAGYLRHPFAEPFREEAYTPRLLRNRMLNELFHETVPVILHEDDLNAMSVSIENRSPFLDRELFAFSQRIPTRHLVRDGRAKAVLRDAMRGIVPDRVLDSRRKVGFNAPIAALLDARDPAVRREVLADSPLFDHVRRDRVAALLDTDALPNSKSKTLFTLLNAKVFLEAEAGAVAAAA